MGGSFSEAAKTLDQPVEEFKQWKPATIRVKLNLLKEWAKGEGKKIGEKRLGNIFHGFRQVEAVASLPGKAWQV